MSDVDYEAAKKIVNKKYDFIKPAKDVYVKEWISTGSIALDEVLGGWPMGRIVLLWGTPGSAKSTLSMWGVANAQQAGKRCLWIDADMSFDKNWAVKTGVDVEKLDVIVSPTLETILEKVQPLAQFYDVIVIDSISSIQKNIYFENKDHSIGAQARASKELLSKLHEWNPESLIIMVSQTTTTFNAYGGASMTYTGGRAVGHHATIILKTLAMSVDNPKKNISDELIITWTIDKSRSSLYNVSGKYQIDLNTGLNDTRYELLKLGVEVGAVNQAGGGNFSFNNHKWKGYEAVFEALEDADIYKELKDEVSRRGFTGKPADEVDDTEEI